MKNTPILQIPLLTLILVLVATTASLALDNGQAMAGTPHASPAATNLIKNASFETPLVPVGGYTLFALGKKFVDWTVGTPGNVGIASGSYRYGVFTWPAQSGKQWLDLTGVSNTPTGIAQTATTTPGHTYTLSFYVGNIYDPRGDWGMSSTVNVRVNGKQVLKATNSTGKGLNKQVWQKFTTKITATSTIISFINGDPRTDNSCGLDAITLN